MMRCGKGALLLVMTAVCACHRAPPDTPTVPLPPKDVVALLPDPDTGTVGEATVASPVGGSVALTGERAATRVMTGQPPGAPFTMPEGDVQRLFGEALAARPQAPRHFLLYFHSGSPRLTRESENLLTDIVAFVRSRPAPDLTVAGHTDTMGAAQSNFELGRSRAALIRDRLVAAGLDGSLVSVASHGESDPLVATSDETPEPRNRRVEVSVR